MNFVQIRVAFVPIELYRATTAAAAGGGGGGGAYGVFGARMAWLITPAHQLRPFPDPAGDWKGQLRQDFNSLVIA
ncbi:hypothetical protein FOCC_FOCC001335 [Frankliniella occidentalis]|nr:hypothetical protein FOCC_FOCC001335 [Frankliniella occidentalis]